MAKLYSLNSCEDVINKYHELDGYVTEVEAGTLGYGITVCFGEGLKTCIITEVYLNEWSSAHTIRFYNKMPKKYEQMLDKLGAKNMGY